MSAITERRIAVIGQGYVGLPVAHAAHEAGYTVIGYDVDDKRVDELAEPRSPIEDVTDDDLFKMLATGRYLPTSDPGHLAGVDVAIVTVPTPLTAGRPDLTAVLAAARAISDYARGVQLVVLESTVAPGTTRRAFTDALGDGQADLSRTLVAFSPERIDPGNAMWRFSNTPKLVGGTTNAATFAAAAFYETLCETVEVVESAEVAEMAKLLENTYRHVNIALVNELGRHAHRLGIDIRAVVAAAATKPYGFMSFQPGPGVGGHCLPIDPVYLSDAVERTGHPFAFVDLAMQINAAQPAYVVDRVAELLNSQRKPVNGSRILALGASYKAGSGDLRESPAIEVIERLRARGGEVFVCDPHADQLALHRLGLPTVDVRDLVTSAAATDLVVLLTNHPEFPHERIAGAAPLVFDTRDAFADAPNVVAF
jgi:UDP-N-acetyl-D-glucosamine dehydrogenase